MPSALEPIIKYKMNEKEAFAYKLALIWEQTSREIFPDLRHHLHLRIKGDPRKSILFKTCYKLAAETNGLLRNEEYKLYMLAQLQMMKALGEGQDLHPMIEPQLLVGPKAWTRWRIWKEKWDNEQKKADQPIKEGIFTANRIKIFAELESTKKFLAKIGTPDYAQFGRYIALKQVSPYYVLLSPKVRKTVAPEDYRKVFRFDPQLYLGAIDDSVKEQFRKIFEDEYAS